MEPVWNVVVSVPLLVGGAFLFFAYVAVVETLEAVTLWLRGHVAKAVVTSAVDVQDDPEKSPDYQLTVRYLDPTGRERTVELAAVVNYPYEAGENMRVLYKPDDLDYVLPGLSGTWLTKAIFVPVLLAVGLALMALAGVLGLGLLEG